MNSIFKRISRTITEKHYNYPTLPSILTLMLLVAYLVNTKRCKKTPKITETLANGYSSESTQRELSNEYQDDRVSIFFQESCNIVLWMKVVLALEGLSLEYNLSVVKRKNTVKYMLPSYSQVS